METPIEGFDEQRRKAAASLRGSTADALLRFLNLTFDLRDVDLFEIREYKPVRIASAAKKEAEAEGKEQLQTGRKYLYTVGRTKQLFGDMPADVINSCVRGEDGGPKVFPAF